jgi:hypothetical protein
VVLIDTVPANGDVSDRSKTWVAGIGLTRAIGRMFKPTLHYRGHTILCPPRHESP